MTSKYWIKLYHEILDDPKMGRMPEILFARCIKLFLLAGEINENGLLPSTDDIAWRLRLEPEEVENDLIELQKIGIIIQIDGRWVVKKFAERQNAMEPALKMRLYREHKKENEYYDIHYSNVTDSVTTPVTNSNTDTDIDIDKETEAEAEEEEGAAASAAAAEIFDSFRITKIICDTSGMASIPPSENQRIEQIHSMIDIYGYQAVFQKLKAECDRWKNTRSKSGVFYRVTNMGWVDWAQDALINNGRQAKDPKDMTGEEYLAWQKLQVQMQSRK